MSSSDLELQKMVRGFRVSDLQSLLVYAGRNKGGKKGELQSRALDLIKLRSPAIDMKIRELHMNRYQQGRGHAEPPEMFSLGSMNDSMSGSYSSSSNHKTSMGPGIGIPGYVDSINHQMLRSVPALNVLPQYAVNPDVSFKDLPFFDVLSDLLKPTSLVPLRGDGIIQEKELVFYLGPQDLRQMDSTDVQVQLRIGCLENNCEQEDEFPSSICLKVNNKVATLPNPIPTNKPGVEPKRPKRPVDISAIIRKNTTDPQIINVSWASSNSRPYVMGVFLVRKQTSSILIKRLKDIGVRNPDHTTAMIKEKLCHDRDSEIATMSLRGSLICPLGKIKMGLPCRALTCTHLQCFDAALYIQMNEKKPKWICPVCDKPAVFKSLAIDGLFLDITRKAPTECTEVQFHENGSWTPVIRKKAPEIRETIQPEPKVEPKPKKSVEVISLDSDSDTEDSWPVAPPKKKSYKPMEATSPVILEHNTNSASSEHSLKSYDMLQACSSKSIPSTSKSGGLSLEKSLFPGYLQSLSGTSPTIDVNSSPTFSPQSPAPDPASSTFQDTVDILNNSSSSTAGQCSYDFDLYSLIQQNHEEAFQYQDSSANETIPISDDTPDIISLD